MQSVNRLRPNSEISLQSELSKMIGAKQHQISTGRRLEKPSQDPAAWSQISDVAKHQANIGSWLRNVERAQTVSKQAENVIGDVGNQLTRAKELMIKANNETFSTENRELMAIEIEAIGDTIQQFINAKNNLGAPLFADNLPIEFPVDENITITPAPSKTEFSGSIALMSDIAEVLRTGGQSERNAMLDALDSEITHMANAAGRQGIVGGQLEQASDNLKSRELDFGIYRSSIEDADITESIVSMQKLLVNLQAAQATYAKIEQSSLFDMIR